jgi:hypothetical protein
MSTTNAYDFAALLLVVSSLGLAIRSVLRD